MLERRVELADDWVTPLRDFVPTMEQVNIAGTCLMGLFLIAVMMNDRRKHNIASTANKAIDIAELPKMTLDMVNVFDGRQFPKVYCCLKGRVYDVSTSRNFVPGASYHFLAGNDCTVGMAKMSHDRQWVNDMDFEQLTKNEWDSLEHWVDYMNSRYKCVGLLCEYLEYEQAQQTGPTKEGE